MMNTPLESQPFFSSADIVSDAKSAFMILEQQSSDLYQRLQSIPKENLSLEQLQKVIGLMLEIKKQLPVEDILQMAGEKAKKTPALGDAEDRAAQEFRAQLSSGVQEGKDFVSSLDSWFSSGKTILFASLKTLLKTIAAHPQVFLAVVTALLTRNAAFSPTGFINSIFAGASENTFLIKMIAWIVKMPPEDIALLMKEGLLAYLSKKGKEMIFDTGSTAIEGNYPAKVFSALPKSAPARTPLPPLSFSTALRVGGARALGVLGFLAPKEMGDGMLTPEQMQKNQGK